MDFLTRLRNYGFWGSIIAFIPIFLKSIGIDILPENFNEVMNTVLGLFVVLGIINNPTTENKGYLDD